MHPTQVVLNKVAQCTGVYSLLPSSFIIFSLLTPDEDCVESACVLYVSSYRCMSTILYSCSTSGNNLNSSCKPTSLIQSAVGLPFMTENSNTVDVHQFNKCQVTWYKRSLIIHQYT